MASIHPSSRGFFDFLRCLRHKLHQDRVWSRPQARGWHCDWRFTGSLRKGPTWNLCQATLKHCCGSAFWKSCAIHKAQHFIASIARLKNTYLIYPYDVFCLLTSVFFATALHAKDKLAHRKLWLRRRMLQIYSASKSAPTPYKNLHFSGSMWQWECASTSCAMP